MFCPLCRSEFREGFDVCDDCGAKLIEALPIDDDLEIVAVLRTNNQPLIAAFQTALSAAEIPNYARGAEATSLIATQATVVVPREHVEAARELLRGAEEAHGPAEGSED